MTQRLAEQLFDAVVAQVANRPLVSVMHLFLRSEFSSLDVESHLLVGIAERHTGSGKAINLFHREHKVVAAVVENVFVHLDFRHHSVHHVNYVVNLVESRQKLLFCELQIAEVARRQIVGNQRHLHGQRLQFIAFGTSKLKHVGVLFMRHNRRAGGVFVGQLDEPKVLRIKHAGIKSKFSDGCGYVCNSLRHDAFGFATSHLGIHHIIHRRAEAQQAGGHGAVERKRRAVAGSRTQRIAVINVVGSQQQAQVVGKALGVGSKPQPERRWHSHLQVGVARH